MRANELESERMNAVFLGHFFLMSFLLYLTLFSRFAPFLTLPVWVALIRLWAPIVQMCTHWLIGAHWFSSIELFSLVCVCVWRLWPFAHSNFLTCEMVRTAIHSTFLINTWILHENLRQSLLTGTFFHSLSVSHPSPSFFLYKIFNQNVNLPHKLLHESKRMQSTLEMIRLECWRSQTY